MRDELQQLATSLWLKEPRGTIVLPTGTGKTKVGVMVMSAMDPAITSILIVVPRIPLISQWEKEIIKWGYNMDKVTIKCINSVYKSISSYDLVVIDEVHRSLSDKFIDMYSTIEFKYLLGLTATVPRDPERQALLNEFCPVLLERDINDSLNIGAVSPFKVYNLAVNLSPTIKNKYNAFNSTFNQGIMVLSRIKSQVPQIGQNFKSAFDIAKSFRTGKASNLPSDIHDDLVKASKAFWSGMTLRKKILYDNPEKLSIVKQIYLRYPSDKWIIFTKTIDLAKKISDLIPNSRLYHSKMKTLDRETTLEDFQSNRFNVLITVDALNEGLDVPDVDKAISVSGTSTELEQIQRLGRCIRLKEGKEALFINLYVPGTPEERWVRGRTEKLDPKWVFNVKDIGS